MLICMHAPALNVSGTYSEQLTLVNIVLHSFRAFDKDANGMVTDLELTTVMRTFGEPLVSLILRNDKFHLTVCTIDVSATIMS